MNIITFDELKDREYGKRGTKKREAYEADAQQFIAGILLQEARKQKGMTQDELAKKCGTTKSYISKIENNIKEVRISTLQKIVERGLGGHLNISVSF
jgi:DNA-binding XRE family transcriptional regulator